MPRTTVVERLFLVSTICAHLKGVRIFLQKMRGLAGGEIAGY
jgi:hypothetical protein